MGKNFKITGLDKLEKNLKDLDGENKVPLSELFSNKFMQKNSTFTSFSEFADESTFDFSDIESIPEDELDIFITKKTNFASWKEMLNSASKEWAIKKLQF